MTQKRFNVLLALFCTLLTGAVLAQGLMITFKADAGAPSGLAATIATSSTRSVGKQKNTLIFEENSVCAARVISTGGQPIKLAIGETATTTTQVSSTTVNAIIGINQAASTTVVYDSGQFGCGVMSAYGFEATTTITVHEYR